MLWKANGAATRNMNWKVATAEWATGRPTGEEEWGRGEGLISRIYFVLKGRQEVV